MEAHKGECCERQDAFEQLREDFTSLLALLNSESTNEEVNRSETSKNKMWYLRKTPRDCALDNMMSQKRLSYDEASRQLKQEKGRGPVHKP